MSKGEMPDREREARRAATVACIMSTALAGAEDERALDQAAAEEFGWSCERGARLLNHIFSRKAIGSQPRGSGHGSRPTPG